MLKIKFLRSISNNLAFNHKTTKKELSSPFRNRFFYLFLQTLIIIEEENEKNEIGSSICCISIGIWF